MDPIACLHDCISAGKDGDRETAKELLQAYREWIDRGGFRAPPYLVAEAVSWIPPKQ